MNNLSLISYHFIVKNKSFLLVQRKNSGAGRESFLRESQISIHSFIWELPSTDHNTRQVNTVQKPCQRDSTKLTDHRQNTASPHKWKKSPEESLSSRNNVQIWLWVEARSKERTPEVWIPATKKEPLNRDCLLGCSRHWEGGRDASGHNRTVSTWSDSTVAIVLGPLLRQ